MGEKRIFYILPPHLFHMLKPVADHHLARLECFNPSFTQKMRFLDIRVCKNIQIITFTTTSVCICICLKLFTWKMWCQASRDRMKTHKCPWHYVQHRSPFRNCLFIQVYGKNQSAYLGLVEQVRGKHGDGVVSLDEPGGRQAFYVLLFVDDYQQADFSAQSGAFYIKKAPQ